MMFLVRSVRSSVRVKKVQIILLSPKKCQRIGISVRLWGLAPVPVAARSKAWVCGRSPAEIVGSNPTGGMDVSPL